MMTQFELDTIFKMTRRLGRFQVVDILAVTWSLVQGTQVLIQLPIGFCSLYSSAAHISIDRLLSLKLVLVCLQELRQQWCRCDDKLSEMLFWTPLTDVFVPETTTQTLITISEEEWVPLLPVIYNHRFLKLDRTTLAATLGGSVLLLVNDSKGHFKGTIFTTKDSCELSFSSWTQF